MPELPEVETVVRQLDPLVTGRRLVAVEILDPKLEREDLCDLRGRIESIFRTGKRIAIEVGGPKHAWMAFHLRMTGRLIYNYGIPDERPKDLRAMLVLDRGALLFKDVRRFGTITIHAEPGDLRAAGMEPLADEFTSKALAALLSGSSQALKVWLMRQDRLAGLGNIYASEILFGAGLAPTRKAGSLDWAEVKGLHRATRSVLRRAIQKCGTTFSDFQDARGEMGSFQDCLMVYGRQGLECRKCGAEIQRIVQAQRSTFFCPVCQPNPNRGE